MQDDKSVQRVNRRWMVSTAGLATAAIILGLVTLGYRSDVEHLENELWGYRIEKTQAAEEEKREWEKRQEQKVRDEARAKRDAEMWPRSPLQPLVLTPGELAVLKGKGLDNPYKELIEDLLKHQELIREKGVLGGTMQFLAGKRTIVLGPDRVLAEYEDGHIGGQGLFQYKVVAPGKISWQYLSHQEEW